MPQRRIVICLDKPTADVQRQILIKQGYTARLPKQLDFVEWDASSAGGGFEGVPSCWVVMGDMP